MAVATSDWPFHPDLSDLEVTLPGSMPSNVGNGYGYVGGVAEWTIPLHHCEMLEPRPGGESFCEHRFDARSASVSGRVIVTPCNDPLSLWPVRLTERFAGGGAVIRTWGTGWEGEYRFEGIEPGSELVLDLGPGMPAYTVPPLTPWEHFHAEDMFMENPFVPCRPSSPNQ